MRRPALISALAASLLLGLAGSAAAHVEVSPAVVATDDAVEFTVTVPGETSARTTKVELQIPKDVLPFSFSETPGWKRSVTENPDGSPKSIVWQGQLASDGFAKFGFMASTPADPTTLAWKSIQTYSDGQVVRWIGSPESEYPASSTEVKADVAKEGAGGKHGGEGHSNTQPTAAGESHGSALSLAALLVAMAALALAIVSFRRSRE